MPSPPREPVRRAVRVLVPPPPPKRIQVVTRPAAPAPKPPPPELAPEYFGHGAGLTRDGMAALAMLLAAAVALVLNFTLDWVRINAFADSPFGATTLDRDELRNAYENLSLYSRGLLLWPLWSLIGGLVVFVALIGLDFLGLDRTLTRRLRLTAWTLGAYFGFLLTLSATRFLGAAIVDTMGGSGRITPLGAPYVNLAAGLLLLVLALWRLRAHLAPLSFTPATRTTGLILLAAAAALLLDPFLPYAAAEIPGPGNDGYLGEQDLAEGTGLSPRAEDDFGFALGMVWIILYLAAAAFVASLLERGGKLRPLWSLLVQLTALSAVPLVIGAIFLVLLYVHIPQESSFSSFSVNVSLAFNFLLPVAYGVVAVAYAFYVKNVLRPFLRATAGEGAGLAATEDLRA